MNDHEYEGDLQINIYYIMYLSGMNINICMLYFRYITYGEYGASPYLRGDQSERPSKVKIGF